MCVGCGEDRLDLSPILQDAGEEPQSAVLTDQGVETQPSPTMMLYPNQESFESDVLPILLRHCGAGCHQNSVILDNNGVDGGNHFEFDPEDIEASIEEVLSPAYTKPSSPSDSELFLHHVGNSYGELRDPAERRAIEEWLTDTLVPKGEEGTPTGESGIACNRLPLGDGIGPPGWFDEFETLVNPMLVGTPEQPEGFCSGSGCHTVVDDTQNFHLLDALDPCSARWNFFVSQSFITLNAPSESPLLRKPLGEPSIDPEVLTHGGRQVFSGQDENYILLRNWITDLN